MRSFSTRRRWRNVDHSERADPLRTYAPASDAEVVAVVRAAREAEVPVRAVGSAHSWSDVAAASGYLIAPDGMRAALDLEVDLLGWPAERLERLVRVQAGMRVAELNRYLAGRGLGLPNMGGYDGQTVAGVVSTSTHGSGRDFGPLCDMVRSIDLVDGVGELVRFERADGPTDRERWEQRHRAADHRLVQDDELFAAVLVGMGCLGVICSLMLEVRSAFVLKEQRSETTWEDEHTRIGAALAKHDHYELLLSPYGHGDGGHHRCMITTRDAYEGPLAPWWSSSRRRNVVAELLSGLPGTGRVLQAFAAALPSAVPWALDQTLHALADDAHINPSYKVFNIGVANNLPAISMEIGVPVDAGGTHVAAMEAVFAVADKARTQGRVVHTAPIALRFVAGSPALLSMMHNRELTMMIELILLRGGYGGGELLAAYEDALRPLGGRPHWGQVNHLTRARVEKLYPASFPRWLQARAELDPQGVFDGPFSARLGIVAAAGGDAE